ncbi:MAG: OmpA family protein [Prevotella sp.]|jgi:outer membrane protein OmpA-like peptidoglycan-associated protein|nr:OmpA family protein [Prevotella sp.]
MKKVILIVAAIAISAMPSLAQTKAFVPSKFGDNWFIQLQGGASYTVGEYYKEASLPDVSSPHVAISLGKYLSPTAGLRLQAGGWESKNYYKSVNNDGAYKINYLQVNADGLLNLTNLFLPYRKNRVFNLVGIAGLGYARGFENKDRGIAKTNSIVPRAGLQAGFRVAEGVSLNLEATGNLLPDNFNGYTEGCKYDGMLDVLLGVAFNLSKGGFKMVNAADPEELKMLNDRINDQKALLGSKDSEIDRLKTDLANKPEPQVIVQETKEIKEQTEILMNAVVVFHIGSAKLEQNQDINIFNAARYLMDNPDVNVIVTGYADKSTGTAAVNQRLSEQRAEAVAKILIEKYGIETDRITTKAGGDKKQLFPIDQWNRVVVFTAVAK